MFLDVGCNGRVSDGGVFNSSTLYSVMLSKPVGFATSHAVTCRSSSSPVGLRFRCGRRTSTVVRNYETVWCTSVDAQVRQFSITVSRVREEQLKTLLESWRTASLHCCLQSLWSQRKQRKSFWRVCTQFPAKQVGVARSLHTTWLC